ncbi:MULTISPECIES: cysteine hydrolase family protein [unclassified Rathayibacter]|uniref:cysteine hydrolase family protein n=1 Tax=unclassified Rathayibacter TaxID=2609250 RepID=UPI001FB3E960|nr:MULTISPECIES: cysteine hydrolase [unclassified Rathayibacter]MCJ1674622.1 cysteine hydrolase [Rathayibacter sp. VKM Ac-2929]MCJ1682731.1 cysteine hydrolase [Rathayibacter sp. VKM Ac-2928]
MSVEALDEGVALVVVDLQRATVANPMVHPIGDVVARAASLADAFRDRVLPVVLVTVDLGRPNAGRTDVGRGRMAPVLPPEWSDPLIELGRSSEDLVLVKRGWSAFAGTGLHELLAERGVTQVVLAGVATSFGVESTARDAYDRGYSVVVVVDAVTDLQEPSHENSLRRVLPVLGETGTTVEVLGLLDQPKSRDSG